MQESPTSLRISELEHNPHHHSDSAVKKSLPSLRNIDSTHLIGGDLDDTELFDQNAGTASVSYKNGDRYIGEVINGAIKQGKGKFMFANGDIYDGLFKNDKFDGYGIFTCSEYTYEGDWKAGRKCGDGEIKYSDGEKYIGEFDNDMFEGYGTYTYANGDCYEGNWKHGKRSGEGKLVKSNGEEIYGLWENNELVTK